MHSMHFDPGCSLWLLQSWTGIGIGVGFGSSNIKVQRVLEKPPQNLASSRLGDRLHEYYLPNFLIRGHLHPPSSDQLAASAEENSGYCPTNRNAFSMHNKLVVLSYLTSSATWTWSRKKQQVLDASFSWNSSFLTAWIGLPGTAELLYFVQHRASFLNESWIHLISQQREGRSACQPGLLYDTNSGVKNGMCAKKPDLISVSMHFHPYSMSGQVGSMHNNHSCTESWQQLISRYFLECLSYLIGLIF